MYIDSSAIGFFVKQGHVLDKDQKCLKLIGVSETLRRIFKTDGFEKFIKVYSSKIFQ
ncbi:MAG: hypothetical protein H7A23_00625 [Leptospiraceae bacterium]|nr:hypothetical protein [Leptospiraceae bacterium]MCP5493034.1 hypothetical protein [Leptospiraceae bacterium]